MKRWDERCVQPIKKYVGNEAHFTERGDIRVEGKRKLSFKEAFVSLIGIVFFYFFSFFFKQRILAGLSVPKSTLTAGLDHLIAAIFLLPVSR